MAIKLSDFEPEDDGEDFYREFISYVHEDLKEIKRKEMTQLRSVCPLFLDEDAEERLQDLEDYLDHPHSDTAFPSSSHKAFDELRAAFKLQDEFPITGLPEAIDYQMRHYIISHAMEVQRNSPQAVEDEFDRIERQQHILDNVVGMESADFNGLAQQAGIQQGTPYEEEDFILDSELVGSKEDCRHQQEVEDFVEKHIIPAEEGTKIEQGLCRQRLVDLINRALCAVDDFDTPQNGERRGEMIVQTIDKVIANTRAIWEPEQNIVR